MANRRRYNEGSYGHQVHRRTCSKSQNQIRQYSVPSWEKKFCFMVGNVPWKRLLESHKHISQFDEVVQWNDLAGKKAFHNAKSRFWAKINGLPCKISLPDPDVYIDEIHWNPKIEPELLSGLEVAPDEIENGEEENVIYSFDITLDQIKPTGWDVDYTEQVHKPKLLTGMVVGDCESSDDDKICLRDSSNFQGEQELMENSWENPCCNRQGNAIYTSMNANCKRRIDGDRHGSSRCTKSRVYDMQIKQDADGRFKPSL